MHHGRWWFQADLDQALDDVHGPGEIEPEAAQEREAERELDQNDKSQRDLTIARTHWLKSIWRGGHPRQLLD